MMSDLRKAAEQALEALEAETATTWGCNSYHPKIYTAIAVLRDRLAQPEHSCVSCVACEGSPKGDNNPCDVCGLVQPEQEPVAWMVYTLDGKSVCVTDNPADFTGQHRVLPLYTTLPQRKPLTEEEVVEVFGNLRKSITGNVFLAFARAIEAAHGIKGEA